MNSLFSNACVCGGVWKHTHTYRQTHTHTPPLSLCSKALCVSLSPSDLLQNPLIVPVKVLRGHTVTNDLGVLDVTFHPSQPWLFSCGADATIRLFT